MARQGSSSSSLCCSVPVLKFALAIYNILLLACGGAVTGVAVWSIVTRHYAYGAVLSSPAYQAVAFMLLVAGVVSVVAGILGCCALAREDRCSLITYIFLLVLVLVLEGVAGVVAYVYEEQLPHLLTESLPGVINEQYYVNEEVTLAVDSMQKEFRCCGGTSYSDWRESTWFEMSFQDRPVPDSCCKTVTMGCGARDHPSNIWYTGCVHGLAAYLGKHLLLLGALGCGLCLLQVLGVTLACCLYVSLAKSS